MTFPFNNLFSLRHTSIRMEFFCEMKSSVFWDIYVIPRSPLNVNRRFGGTCRLHIQGRR
jgi:hypothetical protein